MKRLEAASVGFPSTQLLMELIYLFGVLRRFQHCTGHITTGSWKGRGKPVHRVR